MPVYSLLSSVEYGVEFSPSGVAFGLLLSNELLEEFLGRGKVHRFLSFGAGVEC